MVSTFEKVSQHISDVTAEQIGKCTKIWDFQTSQEIYLVENEAEDFDNDGQVIEYPVRYSEAHGYTCGCPSGKYGFANVKHPSGVCKHIRWVVACILEEQTALTELSRTVHAQALPAIVSTEKKWNIPAWMLNAPVAPHMKHATKER
jgi:hypothetical protein